ncbi:unnamed protein product [Arctogadus glacialis]
MSRRKDITKVGEHQEARRVRGRASPRFGVPRVAGFVHEQGTRLVGERKLGQNSERSQHYHSFNTESGP